MISRFSTTRRGFLLASGAACACAQEADGRVQAQLLRKPYASTVTGKERDYFLFLPIGYDTEKAKSWPVILFMHGGGERGDGKDQLEIVLRHGPLKEAWVNGRDLPFIIVSPQLPRPQAQTAAPARAQQRSQPARPPAQTAQPPMTREITGTKSTWGDQGPAEGWYVNEKDVLKMVDDTLRDYRCDPDRVYVTGLSNGGFGTWYFASAYPERWAAVAPICSHGNPQTLHRIAAAKLPIWIFAGGRDRTVRPDWVLESAVALEKAGHPDVRFTVHEDRPHDAWTRVYEGWDIYNWFLQHRRTRTG
jgi:predicted peptidase